VVWQRIHPYSLDHDHRASAAHDPEKGVLLGLLVCDLESKRFAIEGKRCRCVLDYEEWRNTGDFWLSHVSFSTSFYDELTFL
jgi:hypothetical protein